MRLPHLAAWQVEDAICDHYAFLAVPEDFAAAVRQQIEQTIADQVKLTEQVHAKLRHQLARPAQGEQRLIDLAADGMLDRSKILECSNAITVERARIEGSLADTSAELRLGAERLSQCLDLIADPAKLYGNAEDVIRRQLNQTFSSRIPDGRADRSRAR